MSDTFTDNPIYLKFSEEIREYFFTLAQEIRNRMIEGQKCGVSDRMIFSCWATLMEHLISDSFDGFQINNIKEYKSLLDSYFDNMKKSMIEIYKLKEIVKNGIH